MVDLLYGSFHRSEGSHQGELRSFNILLSVPKGVHVAEALRPYREVRATGVGPRSVDEASAVDAIQEGASDLQRPIHDGGDAFRLVDLRSHECPIRRQDAILDLIVDVAQLRSGTQSYDSFSLLGQDRLVATRRTALLARDP